MKRFSELFVATAAFAVALGGTLVGLPLVLDNPALAADRPAVGQGDEHFPMPSERIDARLAYIKTALKITDAQTGQWNAFADVMRGHAKDADAAITEMREFRDQKHTVIDRMERTQRLLMKEAAHLEELLAAARPLYASLSDDQKKTADDLLAPRFGGRPWFRHGPGYGEPGHGESGSDGAGRGPAPKP